MRRQIDTFHESAEHLFPSLNVYEINFSHVPFGDDIISDGEDDDETTVPEVPRGDVEKMDLLLPSSWPGRLPPELSTARLTEIQLRLAQADEALEGIRREICHKSYIYRNNVRLAENKKGKQRGYNAANAADHSLKQHVRVYKQAHWALGALQAPDALTERFQVLHPADLQPLKSIYLPNAPGQSNLRIPWIWRLAPALEADSEYLEERKSALQHLMPYPDAPIVYRINWLRAWAKKSRWVEESLLIPMEMDWTVNFFENKAREWQELGTGHLNPGPRAYAFKQCAMWRQLAERAVVLFTDCKAIYSATSV